MKKITVLLFGVYQVVVIYDNLLYVSDALDRHTDGYEQEGARYFFSSDSLIPVANFDTIWLDVEG